MLLLDSFIYLYNSVILNKNMIKTIFDSDLKIPFDKSDRILFMADKRINKKENLKNY